MSIEQEVKEGIEEAFRDTGDGNFVPAKILVQNVIPTSDPWEPEFGEPTEYPVSAVRVNFTFAERNSSLIETCDAKFLVSSVGQIGNVEDGFSFGDDLYDIVEIKMISPAGKNLLQIIYAKRSPP